MHPLKLPANLCYESAYKKSACSAFVLQNIAVTMSLDKKDPTPFSTLCYLPSLLWASMGELRLNHIARKGKHQHT